MSDLFRRPWILSTVQSLVSPLRSPPEQLPKQPVAQIRGVSTDGKKLLLSDIQACIWGSLTDECVEKLLSVRSTLKQLVGGIVNLPQYTLRLNASAPDLDKTGTWVNLLDDGFNPERLELELFVESIDFVGGDDCSLQGEPLKCSSDPEVRLVLQNTPLGELAQRIATRQAGAVASAGLATSTSSLIAPREWKPQWNLDDLCEIAEKSRQERSSILSVHPSEPASFAEDDVADDPVPDAEQKIPVAGTDCRDTPINEDGVEQAVTLVTDETNAQEEGGMKEQPVSRHSDDDDDEENMYMLRGDVQIGREPSTIKARSTQLSPLQQQTPVRTKQRTKVSPSSPAEATAAVAANVVAVRSLPASGGNKSASSSQQEETKVVPSPQMSQKNDMIVKESESAQLTTKSPLLDVTMPVKEVQMSLPAVDEGRTTVSTTPTKRSVNQIGNENGTEMEKKMDVTPTNEGFTPMKEPLSASSNTGGDDVEMKEEHLVVSSPNQKGTSVVVADPKEVRDEELAKNNQGGVSMIGQTSKHVTFKDEVQHPTQTSPTPSSASGGEKTKSIFESDKWKNRTVSYSPSPNSKSPSPTGSSTSNKDENIVPSVQDEGNQTKTTPVSIKSMSKMAPRSSSSAVQNSSNPFVKKFAMRKAVMPHLMVLSSSSSTRSPFMTGGGGGGVERVAEGRSHIDESMKENESSASLSSSSASSHPQPLETKGESQLLLNKFEVQREEFISVQQNGGVEGVVSNQPVVVVSEQTPAVLTDTETEDEDDDVNKLETWGGNEDSVVNSSDAAVDGEEETNEQKRSSSQDVRSAEKKEPSSTTSTTKTKNPMGAMAIPGGQAVFSPSSSGVEEEEDEDDPSNNPLEHSRSSVNKRLVFNPFTQYDDDEEEAEEQEDTIGSSQGARKVGEASETHGDAGPHESEADRAEGDGKEGPQIEESKGQEKIIPMAEQASRNERPFAKRSLPSRKTTNGMGPLTQAPEDEDDEDDEESIKEEDEDDKKKKEPTKKRKVSRLGPETQAPSSSADEEEDVDDDSSKDAVDDESPSASQGTNAVRTRRNKMVETNASTTTTVKGAMEDEGPLVSSMELDAPVQNPSKQQRNNNNNSKSKTSRKLVFTTLPGMGINAKMEVNWVAEGGPAAKEGVRIGDLVKDVNGEKDFAMIRMRLEGGPIPLTVRFRSSSLANHKNQRTSSSGKVIGADDMDGEQAEHHPKETTKAFVNRVDNSDDDDLVGCQFNEWWGGMRYRGVVLHRIPAESPSSNDPILYMVKYNDGTSKEFPQDKVRDLVAGKYESKHSHQDDPACCNQAAVITKRVNSPVASTTAAPRSSSKFSVPVEVPNPPKEAEPQPKKQRTMFVRRSVSLFDQDDAKVATELLSGDKRMSRSS